MTNFSFFNKADYSSLDWEDVNIDGTNFDRVPQGIYVGTGGDVVVVSQQGNEVTFKGVTTGTILPIQPIRIQPATKASNLKALYKVGQVHTELEITEPLLLDSFTDSAAAYSLRKLRNDYSGSAVRVLRTSDATEQDIGFLGGELDTASLLSFVGAGDGLITTWYDQSGNSNDATQATQASMPKLVDAGSLVTENGKVALDFDGEDDGLLTSAVSTSFDNASLFVVSKNDVTSRNQSMIRLRPNGSAGTFDGIVWEQGLNTLTTRYSTNTMIEANGNNVHPGTSGIGTQDLNQHLNTLLFNQSEIISYEDAVNDFIHDDILSGSVPVGTVNINDSIWIGRNFDSNDREFEGKFQEVVLYFDDQSSNRTSIESNINDYYSIY